METTTTTNRLLQLFRLRLLLLFRLRLFLLFVATAVAVAMYLGCCIAVAARVAAEFNGDLVDNGDSVAAAAAGLNDSLECAKSPTTDRLPSLNPLLGVIESSTGHHKTYSRVQLYFSIYFIIPFKRTLL
jgi:hypothetical protein